MYQTVERVQRLTLGPDRSLSKGFVVSYIPGLILISDVPLDRLLSFESVISESDCDEQLWSEGSVKETASC